MFCKGDKVLIKKDHRIIKIYKILNFRDDTNEYLDKTSAHSNDTLVRCYSENRLTGIVNAI